MKEQKATASLVDELVHQFTDPFAFYRELIQNSIDAGSTRIEVSLSFNPSAGVGLCTASVADWGEGMNRRIIEDYLVTKFRSTKENDLTKIGKFGIGFVSIFACKPDAVTVDTGRDGESWRVLFREDTSYELLQSKAPVEGTRVSLHVGLELSVRVSAPKDICTTLSECDCEVGMAPWHSAQARGCTTPHTRHIRRMP